MNDRNNKLAAIHATAKNLGIGDEERRDIYNGLINKTSLKGISDTELVKVYLHFKSLAGRTANKKTAYPGRPKNLEGNDLEPQMRKIEALLADMKLPWSYGDEICFHVTGGKNKGGIERISWVKKSQQLTAIISALNIEQEKRQAIEQLEEITKTLGLTMEDVHTVFPQLKKSRNRKQLREAVHYYRILQRRRNSPEVKYV